MKTKKQIAEQFAALVVMHSDPFKPPGLPVLAEARVEAMMLAFAWVLEHQLPGNYEEWFEHVRTIAERLRKDEPKRKKVISKNWLCE